jgi:hypothetical protein
MEMMLVKRISTELKETESDVRGVLQASLLEAWGGFAADRFPARESAKALMVKSTRGKKNSAAPIWTCS